MEALGNDVQHPEIKVRQSMKNAKVSDTAMGRMAVQLDLFVVAVRSAAVLSMSRYNNKGVGSRQPGYLEWLEWASRLNHVAVMEVGGL